MKVSVKSFGKMKIGVIHCGSTKAPKINEIVKNAGHKADEIPMSTCVHAKLSAYDGIIISGAPILLSEEGTESYIPYFEGLKSYTKPVLGICFGHQILGALEGGTVEIIDEDRDWQEITYEDHPLFKKLDHPVRMMEDHCEVLLPKNKYRIIAQSVACKNEAMIHKDLPRIGVQFHPETSGKTGEQFIWNFLELCDQHQNSHS